MNKYLKIALWSIVFALSGWFYFESVEPYFTNDLQPRKIAIKPWLVTHFVGAFCTLFLGPLQFWPNFRKRYLPLHRTLGKIYIVGSIIGASTVFYLLFNGYTLSGGIPSLFVLAILWLFMTIAAYVCIQKKDIINHKNFMIRSYVFGLAFIFIRVLNRLDEYGYNLFPFIEDGLMRYTLYEWMCWIYPLVIMEMIMVWMPSLRAKKSAYEKT